MRIAILADPIDNQHAGIHVFTKEMTEALIRNNPGHEIILIREKMDNTLQGAQQLTVWNTRLPIGFASLRLFLLVPFLLRRKNVDVVIEPAHFGPFNLPARMKRVTIIHDLTPILFPGLHRWHSQFLQKLFLKHILNKASLIVSNSDNTTKDICRVYPQNCKKVRRIYPGTGKVFLPTINAEVPLKYRVTKPYFLFVGTIEPRKNLTVLLEAFSLFKSKSASNHMLVIAGGTGWKSDTFYNALKKHPYKDHIQCTGFIDTKDLPALYTMATALIYPSQYEGFGLPVVEAMSCGTPVITAGNSSLYESGGDQALYFETNNANELADRMKEVSDSPVYRESHASGMKKHVEKFNWDNFAVQMWKELSSIVS